MSNSKKKGFFLTRWFKRLFLGHDQEVRDIMQEEQVQTPFRTMLKAFLSKNTVRVGLIGFILIFLFVLIGPSYWKLDLSEQDSTLINLPPSNNFMAVPSELNGNIRDIAAGRTYGIGVGQDGKIHSWGHTRVTDKVDISKIPQEVLDADIVSLAAGEDHAVALSSDGQIYVWGNTRPPPRGRRTPTGTSSSWKPATSSPRRCPPTVRCTSGATRTWRTSSCARNTRGTSPRWP